MSSTYRDTTAGDLKECRLQVKDLNQQLREQKHHNVLLKTENDRLKGQLAQLRDRLISLEAGKPTRHGEAATIGALRLKASEAKQKQQAHGQEMDKVLQEQQQLFAHLTELQQQLLDCQDQLSSTQAGWAATRQDLDTLQQQSDELELKHAKIQEQLTKCEGDLTATKQTLAESQTACVKAEGLRQQLAHQVQQLQQAGKGAATQLQQQLTTAAGQQQASAQQLSSLEEQHGQLATQLAAQQAETARLQQHLGALRQLATPVVKPQEASTVDAQSATPSNSGPTASGALCTSSVSSSSGDSSCCSSLQLTLHDVTISPEPAGIARYDMWCMLVCDAPGISRRPVLVCGEPPSSPVTVSMQHQQGAAEPQALLQLLSASSLCLELTNLKTALLGGLRCPAPAGHPQAGQVLPMLLCAGRHGPRVTALHLFTLPDSGVPVEPHALALTASVDWRAVLPATAATPRQDECVVALRQLEPLVLESLRVSGLFLPGRSFTGTDGQPYQVWGLQDARARKTATRKYLDKELEVADDLAVASTPLATASVPLTQALVTPSQATQRLQALTAALLEPLPAGQQQPGDLKACPANGTLNIPLRTFRDEIVAHCQLILCLDKDLTLSGPLLQALLAPNLAAESTGKGVPTSGTAGLGASGSTVMMPSAQAPGLLLVLAPPLPGLHWAGSTGMAAEVVSLGRLLSQLDVHVQQAVALLATQRLLHPRDEDTCQQAVLQAIDTCHSVKQQLPSYWSACEQLAQQAAGVSSQERSLALSWISDLRNLAQRSVLRAIFRLRQHRHQLNTAQQLWQCLVDTAGSATTQAVAAPMAAAIPLPSTEQVARLQELENALLMCYQPYQTASAQASGAGAPGTQAPSTTGRLIAQQSSPAAVDASGSASATIPGVTIMQGAELLCGAYIDSPLQVPPPDVSVSTAQQQAADLLHEVQVSLEAAIPVISHVVEVCRKQIGGVATGTSSISSGQVPDPVDALATCQQNVSSQAAGVSSTLVQSLTILLTAPVCDVQQPAAAISGVYQVLATMQVQLQVVWAQLSKVQPTSLPPASLQRAGTWLKAALALNLQLSSTTSLWSACAAYLSAQRLLLVDRQRVAAVQLVLEALSSDAVRAAQSVQARILELRSSKVCSQDVVEEAAPHLLPNLAAHTLSSALLPLHVATQCLVQALPVVPTDSATTAHLQPLLGALGRVQLLQQLTGAGVCDVQDALLQAAGDANVAAASRDTTQGLVGGLPASADSSLATVGASSASAGATHPLQGWRRSAIVMLVGGAASLQPAQGGPNRVETCLQEALHLLGWRAVSWQQQGQLGAGSNVTAVVLLQGPGDSEQQAVVARQCARDTGAVLLSPYQDAALQQVLAVAAQAPQQHDLARYLVARVALECFAIPSTNGSSVQQHSCYLVDPGVIQPLLAASRAAVAKLRSSLESVQAAGQNSLLLQGPVAQMAQSAQQAVAQQQLQFEGLLMATEMYRETAMYSTPQPAVSQRGTVQMPALPGMPSRTSRQPTPSQLSAAAAQLVAQTPSMQGADRDSTASEQEEQYVRPLSQVVQPKGRDWEVESDAASVVSTSTTGLPARSTGFK